MTALRRPALKKYPFTSLFCASIGTKLGSKRPWASFRGFLSPYVQASILKAVRCTARNPYVVGVDRGVPNPRFPPPYPHFPPPRPPLPSPSSPTSLPLEYFSRPHRKKQKQQVISSYNLSLQCMDYYQSFKTVWQFVCLFLRSFVSLFLSFTT